jgi:hypothetical protein
MVAVRSHVELVVTESLGFRSNDMPTQLATRVHIALMSSIPRHLPIHHKNTVNDVVTHIQHGMKSCV